MNKKTAGHATESKKNSPDQDRSGGTDGPLSGLAKTDAELVRVNQALRAELEECRRAEKSRRENELRLQSMADETPVMIWATDERGRMQFVNRAFRDFFGVTLEDVQREGWLQLIHPDDEKKRQEAFLTSLQERKSLRVEARVRRADGVWRWIESYCGPGFSLSGEYLGIRGSSPDITDRKRAEKKISHLASFPEMNPDPVLELTLHGKITYINPVMASLFPDILKRQTAHPMLVLWPEIQAAEKAGKQTLNLETETEGKIFEQRVHFVRESRLIRIYHKDITGRKEAEDRLRRLNDELEQHVRERTAELTMTIEILRKEIMERNRAESALRESEAKYRSLFENSMDAVLLAAPDGAILSANPAACEIFGMTEEKICGAGKGELLNMHDPGFRAFLAERAEKGKARGFVTFVRADGAVVPVELTSIIFTDKDGTMKTSMIVRDITERLNKERELKRSGEELRRLSLHLQSVREEERSSIAREIHDELGQILTALKVDASQLKAKASGDSLYRKKTQAMLDLIDGAIESVKKISTELRPAMLDHLGLVPTLEWHAREFYKRTGISCALTCEFGHVMIGQEQSIAIFRFFQEALTNVLRHAGATAVKTCLREREGSIVLTIEDNGKGISDDEIMNPESFGLLGMRERVRSFGGTVNVLGIPDEGTLVSITIPIDSGQLP